MDRTFTLAEARALLPTIREREAELVTIRADLATMAHAHNAGEDVAVADIKALEARMGEVLDRLSAAGALVKGYAPLLVDLPIEHEGRTVLVCWLEGDTSLDWYHEVELGFMGRRPLSALLGSSTESSRPGTERG